MKQVCNVPEAIFLKLFNEWSPPTQARDVTVLFWLQACWPVAARIGAGAARIGLKLQDF